MRCVVVTREVLVDGSFAPLAVRYMHRAPSYIQNTSQDRDVGDSLCDDRDGKHASLEEKSQLVGVRRGRPGDSSLGHGAAAFE